MDLRPIIIFLALAALIVWLPSFDIINSLCEDDFVKFMMQMKQKDGAASCFDFWLYRYQNLLSAALFSFSVFLATLLLKKHIKCNMLLVSSVLGDVEPDFFLEWVACPDHSPGEYHDGVLSVQNLNRRPISLRRIELMSPFVNFIIREFEQDLAKPDTMWVKQVGDRAFAINKFIPGHDMNCPAKISQFRLIIREEGEKFRSGMDEEFQFRIEFHLLANPTQAKQVDIYGLIRRL